MKKKSKLIATLSSLGLALAMMVFAVYAATSVTFKVTTNVSFTATKHVQATIVAKDTGKLASAPTDASYTIPAKTGGNQTIGVNKDGETVDGDGVKIDDLQDIEFVGAELDATNKYYGYQIIITNNDDENALSISVTQPQISRQGYKVSWTGTSALSIASNKSLTITCLVEITDLAGNKVTVNKDDLTLDVQLGEIEYEVDYDLFNFTLSDDETYYTAELKTDKVVSGRLVIPGTYNEKTVKIVKARNIVESPYDEGRLTGDESTTNGTGSLDNVTSVVILEGVQALYNDSWGYLDNMDNLEELFLPDSMVDLYTSDCFGAGEGHPFSSCPKLSSISVGNNISDMSHYTFGDMESNREDGSLYVTSRDGSTKYLVRQPEIFSENTYRIEDGTKAVFANFYSDGGILDVIVPESVKTFGTTAFIDHSINVFLETTNRGEILNNNGPWKESARYYYYSEEKNTTTGTVESKMTIDGNMSYSYTYGYWHYDENGKPEIWE